MNVAVIAVAFSLTVYGVLTGGYAVTGDEIQVGDISQKRYTAPTKVENFGATERLRQEARDLTPPVYKRDTEVERQILDNLDIFFTELLQLRIYHTPLDNPYDDDSGIVVISEPKDEPELSIILSARQKALVVSWGTDIFADFRNSVIEITKATLEIGIIAGSGGSSQLYSAEFSRLDWEAAEQNLGIQVVSSVIMPNMTVDEKATEAERERRASEIEPLMLEPGQNIVNEGDKITEDIYLILDSLGYVNKSLSEQIIPITGCLIFVVMSFTAAILYMFMFRKTVAGLKKESLIIFTLYIIIIVVARLLVGRSYFFIPILAFSMLVSMLVETRLAFVLSVFVTVVVSFIYRGQTDFFVYFLLNGSIISFLSKFATQRSKSFSIGLIMSFVSGVTIIGNTLLFEKSLISINNFDHLIFAVLMGLFTVILSIGSLPFWEAAFGIVTPIKLLDLTNPNNPLIRKMVIEAPGTYHHSLIVANLAETAAFDIGANPTLARVGGYYHDIGKLKYPGYFAENQLGENPHDFMDPLSSAQVIIGHIQNGIELAADYKLPKVVVDILSEHHGNTLVKYFFYKAKKAGGEISESDYRYNCSIPSSPESAVVMLADAVEAAVRSVIPQGKSMSEVEQLVKCLIKDKLDDNQLEDSSLTIKDLETVSKSFMRVFKGMYHERITYPKITTKELTEEEIPGSADEAKESPAETETAPEPETAKEPV